MTVEAVLLHSEETNKPYLILDDYYTDEDGTETITIESDGVGLVMGENCMDLPGTYYNIHPKQIDKIMKNNGYCWVKLENNKIKRIEDKVVILF